MNQPDGIIDINYNNERGQFQGSHKGLMMTYHHQTFILTGFEVDQTHFSHCNNAFFVYNNKNVELTRSRYVFPFYIRIWEIEEIRINIASDMSINFPNKNHYINNIKINKISAIEYNGWHITLPPVYLHEINNNYPIGSAIYLNNKITGMVVHHLNNSSLIISTYFMKQIIQGYDLNYANLYYGIDKVNDIFYVKDDWDIYPENNKLEKNDIILEIDNTKINYIMFNDKINDFISIDTWITLLFFERNEINIKIKRNNQIMNILIPRIPIHNILQFKYYTSDSNNITFEKMRLNIGIERYDNIRNDLKYNPKKMFN